jgi:acetone carboxylase, alpha subunit
MITGRRDFDQETTTLPEAMTTGDLYLCYFRGAAGVGDPLERPYDAVMTDIDGEYLLERFAEPVYGVIPGDASATEERRVRKRDERVAEAVPAREWMARERERVLAGDFIEPVTRMYAESMKLSERWADEFRAFWDLPAGFRYDVPTPEVDLVR